MTAAAATTARSIGWMRRSLLNPVNSFAGHSIFGRR
jgi:hypothetical protein